MDTLPPTAFPDYEIEEQIGTGNLTTVYRARRNSDGQLVSVKVVMPEFTSDRIFVRRFLEAGSRAIRLDHPNIARVYEATERDGVVYVVREYIEASCLAEWLAQKGTLSPEQAVPIVRQLASALDYAHSRRMMHGDINDRCIYLDSEGHVKLADFGLVQSVAGIDLIQNQSHGVKLVQGMGAPEYLAPERVQGQGPNRPADIYALGAIAYQLLTGYPPFHGEPGAVLEAQVYQTPLPVHAEDARISPTLSPAITRALAKRPESRYNTATEFARAFAAAAEGIAPGHGTLTTTRPKPAISTRRRPPTVVVAIILIAIVVVVLAWLWNLTGLGQQLEQQLNLLLPSPVPPVTAAPPSAEVPTAAPTTLTSVPAPSVTPTSPLTLTSTPTSAPTPLPSPTETAPSVLTPVAQGSLFSNLVVASAIDANGQPISPGGPIGVSRRPVYVFFDYRNMTPGTAWGHVWLRGNQELSRTEEKWPDDWGEAGRAWIFYTPESSYLPGVYEVRLLVSAQVVATTTFVVQ